MLCITAARKRLRKIALAKVEVRAKESPSYGHQGSLGIFTKRSLNLHS
jgi:hypothetical protein